MEFEDDAFVLAARAHGETGAIVEILERPVHLFVTVKVDERWQDRRELYSAVGLDFDA